jgi:hypothetical protein
MDILNNNTEATNARQTTTTKSIQNKTMPNKHTVSQRQQQHNMTGATCSTTSTTTTNNNNNNYNTSSLYSNESHFKKKKYKYNNSQFGNQFDYNYNYGYNNNYNNNRISNNDSFYNRNNRTRFMNNKHKYYYYNDYQVSNQKYNKYNQVIQFSVNLNPISTLNDNFTFNSTTTGTSSTPITTTTTTSTTTTNNNITTFPYDYAQLPSIVLAKIYSYLPLKDRLNASIACKNWRYGLLNNPCLWTNYDLVVYLCNKQIDLKSAQFKLKHFLKLTKNLCFKFDVNESCLIEKLADCIELIISDAKNLKNLTLMPIYKDKDSTTSSGSISSSSNSLDKIKQKLFKSIKEFISNSKWLEHLSLGFLHFDDCDDEHLIDLIDELNRKFSQTFKSLHISSISKTSVLYLNNNKRHNNKNNNNNESALIPLISNNLINFKNLQYLSINFNDLTDDLIQSDLFTQTLKKLHLNVNNISSLSEFKQIQRNQAWSNVNVKNLSLRVYLNILVQEEFARKFTSILSASMPLDTLRMYFCKSFNPELIQFLSDNYSDSLQSLIIVDSIVEPTLRYHNPLRFDADPDPLILLCWKCKYLRELVVVGYEMLEINLIAIAKLRSNLKRFHVAMDCVIDLKYGQFRNDDFIEDEEGEDTIVDYGFCSDQVIDKVS